MSKCSVCKERDSMGNTELCDPCRLKKWRKDNPDKVVAYAKMRYRRDKKKILSNLKEWNRKNGYASDKTPERRENARIRRATRHKHPLEGNTCQFCNKPAKHRHHTTVPLEIHKFIFLCEEHHNEMHGKEFVLLGDKE